MAANWLLNAIYTSLLGGVLQDKSPAPGLLANTSSGAVRGVADVTSSVVQFLGVPYARPPVGSLRFAAPQEATPWSGVRDTQQLGHICMQTVWPQFGSRYKNLAPSEDCLTLNIYVPTNRTGSGLLPVMVWIHGGGYTIGFGGSRDGTVLAQQGVVVVTINYRLDAFGFMSTEDAAMPGNYGVLDQVAALKWVNKNIANFGGDPNMVTIFGESAGSASVSLLTLSPLAKGLFQRAIMESGSAVGPWAIQNAGNAVDPKTFARLIATGVSCFDLDDMTKLLPCLRNVDADTLQNMSMAVTVALDGAGAMAPRVETDFNFLPDTPINLLTSGRINHVDTIRGYNSEESAMWFDYSLLADPKLGVDSTIRQFIKPMTDLDEDDTVDKWAQHYLKNDMDNITMIYRALTASSNIGFVAPIVTELDIATTKAISENHYLYKFDYRPSFSKLPVGINNTHTSEIPFVFGLDTYPQLAKTASADDVAVSREMVERWTNFAKTGVPSLAGQAGGAWQPYTRGSPHFLLMRRAAAPGLWRDDGMLALYQDVLHKLSGWVDPATGIVG